MQPECCGCWEGLVSCVRMQRDIYTHTQASKQASTHAHTHTHAHTYTRTHTHTHKQMIIPIYPRTLAPTHTSHNSSSKDVSDQVLPYEPYILTHTHHILEQLVRDLAPFCPFLPLPMLVTFDAKLCMLTHTHHILQQLARDFDFSSLATLITCVPWALLVL